MALAGLVFVATQGNDDSDKAAPAASHSQQQPTIGPRDNTAPTITTAPPSPTATATKTPKPPPVIDKAKTNVVIFNNSNVKGLAGRTATKAQTLTWNVVATDNWYGTVDATTVYYGKGLKYAAQSLAEDLGIARVKPAVAPMQADRLTVILTADYKPA
ncbi:LytR C-terminal domain-containing protein [Nocardioides marmorisolisilvae]|uniref:LytR C-terminal domain-containing protein n=1 Tax=Nocardioides marmorisolisilvae TaxID=1542737 RepID=UPI0016161204|nr:LytR C-terminal domain-containing protein [Nocardioides marmorisolisilvae]